MLYFVYRELALGYLLFSFFSALGALQYVAARYHLVGLALLDYSRSRIRGYVLGTVLITGSGLWFFVSQWARILTPGPAGSELTLLFAIGAACALVLALAISAWRLRSRQSRPPPATENGSQTLPVERATGRLYVPPNPTAPMPALCLVPGFRSTPGSMDDLARRSVEAGFVVLVIELDEAGYTYPEILATLPAAISLLAKRPEVNPKRIAALGYDLGGDLVIRATSVDKQIAAVVALAPVLAIPPAGLFALREMSYPQAWAWTRNRRRPELCRALLALEYANRIAPRPFLLLYGAEDSLVTATSSEYWGSRGEARAMAPPSSAPTTGWPTVQTVPGIGHLNLLSHPQVLQTAIQWLREHL